MYFQDFEDRRGVLGNCHLRVISLLIETLTDTRTTCSMKAKALVVVVVVVVVMSTVT